MSTDYGALADYLIALADQMGDGYTTDDDVVTIERLRAAAAALVAERDEARRRVLDEVERRLMEWQEHASNIGLDAMRAERLGEPFDYNAVPVADVRRVLQAMRDGGGE